MWRMQERIAFPGRPAPLPSGQRVDLKLRDGTALAGLYIPPRASAKPAAGMLWFYGNGENIAAIWPIVQRFRPPDAALLIVDYPGYGASGGTTTEAGLYETAAAAYAMLASMPTVDPARIVAYGRSLGTAAATWLAAQRPVAGLILESPFTNAREMSRQQYALFPRFILRLELDNLRNIAAVRSPVIVFHGTADLLVPPSMGRRVADAAPGPAEYIPIEGSGHNETYELGGDRYREKLWEFVRRVTQPAITSP
jgi:fermentation-respiration switch protein FrsA (DUF1100 family)